MRALESFRLAVEALSANKLRSFLTFLGILIGVGAVIASLSIGQGGQAAIERQVAALGTNLLFVRPGATTSGGVRSQRGGATTLTYDDAQAIQDQVLSVDLVAPELSAPGRVVASGRNTFTNILGVTPDYQIVRNTPLAAGDFFTDDDMQVRAQVAVLGAQAAQDLFPDMDPVDQQMTVNNRPFRVIGVLKSKGGTGQGLEDDLILMPLTTVRYRLFGQFSFAGGGGGNIVIAGGLAGLNVQNISVQVKDHTLMDQAKLEIAQLLRDRHRLATGDDDFTITSQDEVLTTRTEVSKVLSILLGSSAGISLLIGGIGIMNIMLVSVTERTREIGIRKAVGAKRRTIVSQFLAEAATLSFLGGGLGVAAGWGASFAVGQMNILGQSVKTVVTADMVVISLAVSAAIGLFFGIYPALRASRLNPIEALRTE